MFVISCTKNIGFYKKRYNNGYYISIAATDKYLVHKKSDTRNVMKSEIHDSESKIKLEKLSIFPTKNVQSKSSNVIIPYTVQKEPKHKSCDRSKVKNIFQIGIKKPAALISNKARGRKNNHKHITTPLDCLYFGPLSDFYFIFAVFVSLIALLFSVYFLYIFFESLTIGATFAISIFPLIGILVISCLAFLIIINSI